MLDRSARIKEETDVNALDTIYKEFMKLKPSKKQEDWIIRDCRDRKDYLLNN